MSLGDLSDPEAVRSALDECDRLGRDAFLGRYGFGRARTFVLLHDGRSYDSKAIAGAAHGHQFGTPLKAADFSGGAATVVPKLRSLGFTVVALELTDETAALSEEVLESTWEGAKRSVTVNAYERSAEARAACIGLHGASCAICSMEFGATYGEGFEGFIHVHHKRPLSEIGERYRVDPENDLTPVCPNCHAVIHYGNRTRSIDEVKAMVLKNRRQR